MTYRFSITKIEKGFIDVEADNIDDAKEKAECLDGDYFVDNNEITNVSFIEELYD